MYEFLAPFESEAVEKDGEHLEMVVLLVAHHIYHLVDREVLETHLGSADVLCHIHRCAVGAQQQFLVESLAGKVSPHRVVLVSLEESLGESFLHLCLSLEVSFRLIVYLVEAHSKSLVSLVEAGIHPVVHFLPQGAHLRVVILPLDEHVVCLLDERSLFLGFLLSLFLAQTFGDILRSELLHLFAVVLVESHIVVADEVVAFLSACLGCFPVAIFQPCEHRLADVYSAVVDDVCLHHFVAVSLHNLC